MPETKAANAAADIKVKHARHIREMRSKQRAASAQMSKLGDASDAAWEQVKSTADKIRDELKTGLADAQAKFK